MRLGQTLLREGCLDGLEWVRFLLSKATEVKTSAVR